MKQTDLVKRLKQTAETGVTPELVDEIIDHIEELQRRSDHLLIAANHWHDKYEALVKRLNGVGEVHPSWNTSEEFNSGWRECCEQFRALLEDM